MVLMTITLELDMILQNISERSVGNILNNISSSNNFPNFATACKILSIVVRLFLAASVSIDRLILPMLRLLSFKEHGWKDF